MIAGGSRDLAHQMDGRKAVQDAETNHGLIVMELRALSGTKRWPEKVRRELAPPLATGC